MTYGVAEKKILDLDGKFKEMSEEIKALQKVLEDYKSQRQVVTSIDRQMYDLCETLGRTSLDVTEYDDKNIRQLIDTIKVMGEDKLLIIFKGGFEMKQPM